MWGSGSFHEWHADLSTTNGEFDEDFMGEFALADLDVNGIQEGWSLSDLNGMSALSKMGSSSQHGGSDRDASALLVRGFLLDYYLVHCMNAPTRSFGSDRE